MAHIEKRTQKDGKVSWRVQIAIKGTPRVSNTFDRKTDAARWAQATEAKIREGLAFGHSRRSLADAIDKWLGCELPKVAPSDQKNRAAQLAWWRQRRGHERLSGLSKSDLGADLAELRACGPKGRPVTTATANRYKAALSAVLTAAAEEWEWLPANPLHRSGKRRRPRSEREAERDRLLCTEERERLWPCLKTSGDSRLYSLVICAVASGARQGELMSMQWGKRLELRPNVYDPETGATRTAVPRYHLPESKNGESRVLYFPGEAGALLLELAKARASVSPFVWADHSSPGKLPEFPRMAFRWALRKARVEDFHFHDLRHQWACDLLDSGATLGQLLILGGWRSYSMIRRYAKRAQSEGGSLAVEAMHRRSL